MRFEKNIKITLPFYCDKGFTLAEVLIALVVVGVIAAITMTTVMPNINERVNSQRQANIVYKITQATNLMKSNGALVDGFASTDAFVDELQKYLKIMKRCDSAHIADCWPTKEVTDSNGDKYEVKDAKNRGDLGFKTNTNIGNVGIVLNDGASLIMTYDPSTRGIAIGDKLSATNGYLPVGGKYQEFLEYTTNTTAGLAFVMDVNGGRGPNKETFNGKMFDIRNLNGARFKGCAGKKVDGECYTPIASFGPINCLKVNGEFQSDDAKKYCGKYGNSGNYYNPSSYGSLDYWAGARKACDEIGAVLPDYDNLLSICRSKGGQLNLSRGLYWANTEYSSGDGYRVDFGGAVWGNCRGGVCGNCNSKNDASRKVLCVEK